MKFDQKFKDEMDLLSPTEEQIERIKKSVYERIERENSESANAPKPRRKPLKIKIAAISGAACACAAALVIIVTGSRGSVMLPSLIGNEANYATDSFKAEGSLNYGANTAPDSIAGGYGTSLETDGSSPDDALIDNSVSEIRISGEGISPGAVSKPSSQDAAQSVTMTGPQMPYLSFSEDKKSCTVTVNGKTTVYEKTNFYGSGSTGGYNIELGGFQIADCGLEENLIVQFDENELYVFYESGEFFGHYKIK